MLVEVFGPGCARCRKVKENVQKAAAEAGVKIELREVSDVREMAQRGVTFTPGVAVDGELKSKGRIPDIDEIKQWLRAE